MTLKSPLLWRADDAAVDAWITLHSAPASNRGFVETKRCFIAKPSRDSVFRIDDEPLLDSSESSAWWTWTPGFFAGEVTAELVSPDGAEPVLFLLDVSPDPLKVGRDTFGQMIDELLIEDPALVVGSEPATTRIGYLGRHQNPWLEFARLRRYAPEFLRAAGAVRAKPRRALEARRRSAPLHRVRHADRQTALSLACSPAVSLVLENVEEDSELPANIRLDVPVVQETLDSAANRTMLALILALLHRARSLDQTLQRLVSREAHNETRTSLGPRWPSRHRVLEQLVARLKILSRQSPFVDVKRAEITAAGLTAVAADPVYARAWNRGWRALRHGVDPGDRSERLWISPSWEIYERWCFLRLGRMLAEAMPEWNWGRAGVERWVGAMGTRRSELLMQPTFVSCSVSAGSMWSVSRQREPDLVLTLSDGRGTRFVVLDAKYRTSRANVLDAMASAHIYQDSLRLGSSRPEASLLLVPMAGGAPWLEQPAFQNEHRVGVHQLSPDSSPALPNLIAQLFDRG